MNDSNSFLVENVEIQDQYQLFPLPVNFHRTEYLLIMKTAPVSPHINELLIVNMYISWLAFIAK